MSIDEIYKIILYIAGKDQKGNITPASFNLLINESSLEYFNFLIGGVEQFQYGSPKARIELGQNRDLMQRLAPFIPSPSSLAVDATTGKLNYPTDYVAVVALTKSDANKTAIKWVQSDELNAHLSSVIDPIPDYPIYLTEATNFQFYPVTIGTVLLSYLHKPVTAVWAFTLDGNGRPIYNAGASVDLNWKEIDQSEIIARCLRKIGVNLNQRDIQQYSNELKTTGT